MIGAIVGDIVGSKYEFNNHRSKKFKLFASDCRFTDDTVMTCAVGKAIMMSETMEELRENAINCMVELGRAHPHRAYGYHFGKWVWGDNHEPYNSLGNGAAMRVSAAAETSKTLEEALQKAEIVTAVTHDHWEGIKGAKATTEAIWMAKNGKSKDEIREVINQKYYKLDFTCDEIRPTYLFDETCQGTVPQAIEAFLESKDFEDAIRLAISIGGDSDTIGAITGSIAEAFYGVPEKIQKTAEEYLTDSLLEILKEYERYLDPEKEATAEPEEAEVKEKTE